MLREPRCFGGVSGGRAAIAASLADLAVARGSSRVRGPEEPAQAGDLAALTPEHAAADGFLLRKIEEAENERPGNSDIPFRPERFGLPEQSVLFPLLKWLSPEWQRLLQDPSLLRNPAPDGPCPPVCLKADRPDWLRYIGRLAGSCLVRGMRASAVVRGPNDEDLWAGGFPVPKSADEDRAITDARRRNWAETDDVPRVKLPCGADFGHRILHPGHVLIHHVFDLPHFYHHLYTGEAYIPYSPLGPPLTVEEARQCGLEIPADLAPGERIQPCLQVLAMGDHKAVAIAQEAHDALLRAAGIEEDFLLKYGRPLPEGFFGPNPQRPWVSVCIDDAVLQSEMSLADYNRGVRGEVGEVADKVLAQYTEVGLPPKESKVKRHHLDVKALGTEILGMRGWASAPRQNLSQLMCISTAVFQRGCIDKKSGEKLLGSWIWPILHRREALCVVDRLYHDIREFPSRGTHQLSAESRDELLMLTLIAPLLRCDMRLPVKETLYAFDAEGSGGTAIVSAPLSQPAAEEIWRFADLHGASTTVHGDAQELAEAGKAGPCQGGHALLIRESQPTSARLDRLGATQEHLEEQGWQTTSVSLDDVDPAATTQARSDANNGKFDAVLCDLELRSMSSARRGGTRGS